MSVHISSGLRWHGSLQVLVPRQCVGVNLSVSINGNLQLLWPGPAREHPLQAST